MISPIKTITLVDGVKVCVPSSLELISSYVLEEQLDWFENEIKFIRKIIHTGNQVIDIGANYGVYTLSIAKLIGTSGKVYSFEPATETAEILLKSLQINNFDNVIVEKNGISKEVGMANLSLNKNSELNSLLKNTASLERSELIKITTLDECMKRFDWERIDFIKIDAEGEEENIIQGGINFFNLNSPLVMFEVKAGDQVNLDLVRQFELLGYSSFKLIPGLNILAPLKKNEIVDDYQLNLFCCKSDTAKRLFDQDVLIFDDIDVSETTPSINIAIKKIESDMLSYNHCTFNLPYTKQFQDIWRVNLSQFDPLLIRSLAFYQESKTAKVACDKYHYLSLAFKSIDSLCKLDSGHLRLSTFARIAHELGHRVAAVNALDILIKNIIRTKTIQLGEPFLLPSEDYETLDPQEHTIKFVWSALLSSLEKIQYFSSFYAGNSSLERLNAIIGTGFFNDEIIRRRDLIIKRYSA